MKKLLKLSFASGLLLSCLGANANCDTLNPTVCSPNGGWQSGPFYGCNDNLVDCCWTKEGTMNCGAGPTYTPTDYKWRFKGYNAICPPGDPSGGCLHFTDPSDPGS